MYNDTATYRDLYYTGGDRPIFCYRSGLSVYEEMFEGGMLVAKGRNAAGYPLDVLSNCPTRLNRHCFTEPQAFNLEIDGESADTALTFLGHTTEETERGLFVRINLASTVKPVEIAVCTLLDGTEVMSRWLEIKNCSDSAVSVNRISIISGGAEIMTNISSLGVPCSPEELYSLGYFEHSDWGKEGDFAFRPLQTDTTSFSGRFGRDRFRQPFFMLKNNLLGTVLFGQLGWSGGYRFSFDLNTHIERDDSALSLKAELTSYAPLLVLEGGETYVTPTMHIGFTSGSVDDAVNAMHAHTRRSVLNLPEASANCLVGSGMGAEHDMMPATTKRFVDQMAEIGCEVFIVDAGWYCRKGEEQRWSEFVGDWKTFEDRYPNGIGEICDYVHSKGMKFGLWVEIERIGRCSKSFVEHPEWRTSHFDGSDAPEFIDLTNPTCAAWAENELSRIITEMNLDLLRVDFNVSTQCYFYIKDHDGKRECASLRHFNAVYGIYEKLKKRFPNVIFENCAGGGGRCDLGMMKSFNHTWVSDRQTAPRSLYITNGMTLMLPPERVDRLVAGMGCHSFASLDFQMRNAMLGHISMNVFSPAAAQFNSQQLEFISHSIKVYKQHIRGILSDCLIFHHEPEVEKVKNFGSTAIEIFSPDARNGAISVFTVSGNKNTNIIVYPRGCNAEKVYAVTFDNSRSVVRVNGYQLLNDGIRISLRAPMTSELLLFESVE